MVLNNWNVVYTVRFDEDAQHLNDEFDSREEAMNYAQEHIADKPIVSGVEVFVDEFGIITDEADPEILFSYADELVEEELPEANPDRLAELEAELTEGKEEEKDVKVESGESAVVSPEVSEVAAMVEEEPAVVEDEIDPYGFVGEVEYTPAVSVDPLACEFSEIPAADTECVDTVCGSLDPAEFLQGLADELGIGDQVEIMPVETPEIPAVKEVEVVADNSAFSEIPEVNSDSAIKFGFDSDFFSDYLPDEEPADKVAKCEVCPECGKEHCEEAPVEVAPEAETAIAVADDVIASEAPVEDIPVGIEHYSESGCCEDPCECMEESLEESKQTEPVLVQRGIPCDVELKGADCADDVCEKQPLIAHDEDTVKDLKKLNETDELTENSELEKHKRIADKFRASLEINGMDESLAEAADIRMIAYNRAVDLATKENKPVIYGLSKGGKFSEISPIVCDDLKAETERLKDATVLVAYPGKPMIEDVKAESLEDTVDADLSDDRGPTEVSETEVLTEPVDGDKIRKFEHAIVDEPEEMSDLELAERLEAAKAEKYKK